jgi:hypothetical protein
MAMLDRYKKKGGFVQLLNLIETSAEKKQEQFLGLIGQESPAWEQELKIKKLSVDRILAWPADVLSEVLSRIQPLTLCVTLHGKSSEVVDKILAPLPSLSKRKLTDQIGELNPSPAERATCEMKLISEVRAIVALGVIKFEKFDGELLIDENIEERLSHADSGIAYLNKIDVKFSHENRPGEQRDSISAAGTSGASAAAMNAEIEIFRKKISLLTNENNALKQEVHVLKDKLAQIKRIA